VPARRRPTYGAQGNIGPSQLRNLIQLGQRLAAQLQEVPRGGDVAPGQRNLAKHSLRHGLLMRCVHLSSEVH
jgi:hypothetical protein